MVETGAMAIDVGIDPLPDGKIVGDVDFEGVSQKASYITPAERRGPDDRHQAARQHDYGGAADVGRNG
jgi:hypothetical protein